MDRGEWSERIQEWIIKYRWAALILAVGLILMMVPQTSEAPQKETAVTEPVQTTDLASLLEEVLCQLEGAGKVTVLLTQASGEERYYQTDSDSREQKDSMDRQAETVIITDSQRSQQGLLRRIDPPRYLGAVVVCQGADRAHIRLAIVDAVGTATGLTSDKISVLKMK